MKPSAMPSSFNALSWLRVGCVNIDCFSSSMEVTRATDVGMCNRRPIRGSCGPFGVEVVLQDRIDRGEGARADLQRPAARRFEPVAAIALEEPDDAEAGAEALLGVTALAHDEVEQRRGIAPDLV